MPQTKNLLMNKVVEGQASGETTVNEALEIIDAQIQFRALGFQSTPPGSPADGDRYIVLPNGTGAWLPWDNYLTMYLSGVWKFVQPQNGWIVFDSGAGIYRRYNGATTSWIEHTPAIEVPAGQRIFQSSLPAHATALTLTSGTSVFVYLGRTAKTMVPKFVEFHVSTIGAGAQTAEVGLFSSPLAPNKANQTLTKIVATGTVDTLVSTGVKRNTAAFVASVPINTHLWAAIRTAMATTQPTIESLCRDMAQGNALAAAASGALTGLTTVSGVIIAAAVGPTAPDLRVTMD